MKRLFLLVAALLLVAGPASSGSLTLLGVGGPAVASAGLACSYTPVTAATYNVAYTGATPSASGGTPTYVFSNTGTLPTGRMSQTVVERHILVFKSSLLTARSRRQIAGRRLRSRLPGLMQVRLMQLAERRLAILHGPVARLWPVRRRID